MRLTLSPGCRRGVGSTTTPPPAPLYTTYKPTLLHQVGGGGGGSRFHGLTGTRDECDCTLAYGDYLWPDEIPLNPHGNPGGRKTFVTPILHRGREKYTVDVSSGEKVKYTYNIPTEDIGRMTAAVTFARRFIISSTSSRAGLYNII